MSSRPTTDPAPQGTTDPAPQGTTDPALQGTTDPAPQGTTDTDVTGPLDDDAVAQGLVNLLVVIGDNKYFLGRHLSQWSVGAPGLEAAVAVAAISQGHLGQARALFPFVDELAGEYTIIGTPDTGRARRYNMACLDDQFDSWPQAVATLFLVDPALDIILRALNETQEELERRIGRVLEESRFHADFARGRVTHLLTTYDAGREQLRASLDVVLPEVLAWFGPQGEQGVETMKDAGVLALDNDQMRAAWLDHVAPVLVAHDLAEGLGIGGGPGAWTHPEISWGTFDGLQRRLQP